MAAFTRSATGRRWRIHSALSSAEFGPWPTRNSACSRGDTSDKLVLHASRSVPGSVRDTVLLRFSALVHQIPCGMRLRLDRHYQGVEAEFPEVPFEKPFKAQRNHPLTWLGKAYNRMQNRIRVAVEHVLAGLEKFQILARIYRGEPQRYNDCFGLVCGLHNYRVLGRLAS